MLPDTTYGSIAASLVFRVRAQLGLRSIRDIKRPCYRAHAWWRAQRNRVCIKIASAISTLHAPLPVTHPSANALKVLNAVYYIVVDTQPSDSPTNEPSGTPSSSAGSSATRRHKLSFTTHPAFERLKNVSGLTWIGNRKVQVIVSCKFCIANLDVTHYSIDM